MRNLKIYIAVFCAFLMVKASGQQALQNVTVETYYVSSADDALYEDGSGLAEGSVTYRVFAELCDSCFFKGFFATPLRPFSISSTEVIFNNDDRGEFWGFEIPDNRVLDNTVMLDSWLSFGGGTDEHWGVLKNEDPDGTLVGTEDDADALLSNADVSASIPLTDADGLIVTETTEPAGFFEFGITEEQKAILGEFPTANEFYSEDFSAIADGVRLDNVDGNKILIAQITTAGELTFSMNIEVIDENGESVKFSGTDTGIIDEEVVLSPFLNYPFVCGCTDPYFLEYNPAAACELEGACVTPIVIGCTDETACNYDPAVNQNIPELCCYTPDNCGNGFLNFDLACPNGVSVGEYLFDNYLQVTAYPNPTADEMNLLLVSSHAENFKASIYDLNGSLVYTKELEILPGDNKAELELSHLSSGSYVLRIHNERISEKKLISIVK